MALLAVMWVPPLPVTHAQAYVHNEIYSLYTGEPFFIHDKSRDQLRMYTTHDLRPWGGGVVRFRSTTHAESGMTTNDCDKHDPPYTGIGGWLPNGWYDILEHSDDYPGTFISGIVWRVSNKACRQSGGSHPVGTSRTQLFIHTTRPPRTHVYESNGCIKVAPNDIWVLNNMFDNAKRYDGNLEGRLRVRY